MMYFNGNGLVMKNRLLSSNEIFKRAVISRSLIMDPNLWDAIIKINRSRLTWVHIGIDEDMDPRYLTPMLRRQLTTSQVVACVAYSETTECLDTLHLDDISALKRELRLRGMSYSNEAYAKYLWRLKWMPMESKKDARDKRDKINDRMIKANLKYMSDLFKGNCYGGDRENKDDIPAPKIPENSDPQEVVVLPPKSLAEPISEPVPVPVVETVSQAIITTFYNNYNDFADLAYIMTVSPW